MTAPSIAPLAPPASPVGPAPTASGAGTKRSSAGPVALHLGRKIITAVITLLALTAIVFTMTKLIPGDEAKVAAGESATPAQVEALRHDLGLDQGLPGQYATYLNRLVHGDLGTSTSSHQPVGQAISQVLPQTIELVVLAMLIEVTVVVPLALLSALKRSGTADTATRLGIVAAAAIPTFWLGIVLQHVLGSQLKVLPISGRLSNGIVVPHRTGSVLMDSLLAGNPGAFWNGFQHLLLPAIVLCLPFAAQLYRTLRTELVRTLNRDHIVVARAKGVPTRRLALRHALPNAMGPALTVIGVQLGAMAGAAVLIESVFGLVGIGSFLTNAVAQKDTFAVLGGVLVIGALVVIASFVVDLIQLIRDPRLRAGQLGA